MLTLTLIQLRKNGIALSRSHTILRQKVRIKTNSNFWHFKVSIWLPKLWTLKKKKLPGEQAVSATRHDQPLR